MTAPKRPDNPSGRSPRVQVTRAGGVHPRQNKSLMVYSRTALATFALAGALAFTSGIGACALWGAVVAGA